MKREEGKTLLWAGETEGGLTLYRMSTQPSMVMHWKTVSTANRMLSKLVMPKLGPVQYSLHLVPLGHNLAGGSKPQGQSAAVSSAKNTTQQPHFSFVFLFTGRTVEMSNSGTRWTSGHFIRATERHTTVHTHTQPLRYWQSSRASS